MARRRRPTSRRRDVAATRPEWGQVAPPGKNPVSASPVGSGKIGAMPSVELQVGNDCVRCRAEKISLGRGLDCDVVLKSTHVSRHHALLAFVNGRWMARDLDSSNGTYLNRHRLGISDIHAGDVLRFGEKGPKVRVVALEPSPIDTNLRVDVSEAEKPREKPQPGVIRLEPDRELTESTTS